MSGRCDGNNSDATASGLGQAEPSCSCCELNGVQVCTIFFLGNSLKLAAYILLHPSC